MDTFIGVIAANAFTNLLDTYILKYDWSRVGFVSWWRNLHAGFPWTKSWIWAPDRFGENMLCTRTAAGNFLTLPAQMDILFGNHFIYTIRQLYVENIW